MPLRIIVPVWVAGMALAGCAARIERAPMAPDAVAYGFALMDSPGAVRVTMRVRGEEDGTSRLAVAPSWGGIENCRRFIHGLKVRDHRGRDLPVQGEADAPGWTVTHEPGAVLTASYELRRAERDPLAEFGTHYEPVVRDDLLHLIGETGLIYPEWLEGQGPVEITARWSGFGARGWTVATSFDAERGTIRRPLHEFRHAMFLAGRVRVHDRRVGPGAVLRVAIHGEDWGFEDRELVDLVERIVTVEREFMRDLDDPYFLVTVVPTGGPATPRSVSLAGTGLTNCFALFLPPGMAVGPDSPHGERFLRLLAHEYFHTWNGGHIRTEEPEELVYWFSEGFTDFYASRLLRRAGLISDAAWLERLNETIRMLWRSPVATEPAETIRREFWTSRDVQQLSYQRGELVALMLDEEIRRVTGGARGLDDFLHEVLEDARAGEKSETGRLLSRVARWTSPEFSLALRRIVVDGGLPDMPARISEPGAARVETQAHRYDPGFDVDASLRAKAATGVREGGPAHAAGLREGQEITGFSVHRGDPDRAIELKIREHGVEQALQFMPRGAALTIPQYVPGSGQGG